MTPSSLETAARLKARGLLPKFDGGLDVFCLIEDESLRPDSLKAIEDLRAAGCCVDYSLTSLKPDKQFRRAIELNASFTVRLERGSDCALQARLKNLRTREEKTLPPSGLPDALRPACATS